MVLLPPASDLALKEWAVTVRAIARGKQIMIMRKGGIHRDDKEFRLVHPEFLLFPTYEHQKHELLKEAYRQELDQTLEQNDVPGLVSLGYWCQVTDRFEVRDEATLDRLAPYHIWTADYANKRLHWRPEQPLTIALVRAHVLQQPQALPVLEEYVGCKSWVELGQDVPLANMSPVLADREYQHDADAIKGVLDAASSAV